jgi:phosphopantothenoylcysteine decarboxylase/phosphopantothenate--cysteine ligase
MNTRMYQNVLVQDNIRRLQGKGVSFVGPAEGRLACGDIGPGRLAPVDEIIEAIEALAGRPEES